MQYVFVILIQSNIVHNQYMDHRYSQVTVVWRRDRKQDVSIVIYIVYIEYVLHVLKNNNVASQVIGVIAIEFGFRTVSRQLLWCGVYGSNTGGHHVRQYPVMRAHSAGTVNSKRVRRKLLSIYRILFMHRIVIF